MVEKFWKIRWMDHDTKSAHAYLQEEDAGKLSAICLGGPLSEWLRLLAVQMFRTCVLGDAELVGMITDKMRKELGEYGVSEWGEMRNATQKPLPSQGNQKVFSSVEVRKRFGEDLRKADLARRIIEEVALAPTAEEGGAVVVMDGSAGAVEGVGVHFLEKRKTVLKTNGNVQIKSPFGSEADPEAMGAAYLQDLMIATEGPRQAIKRKLGKNVFQLWRLAIRNSYISSKPDDTDDSSDEEEESDEDSADDIIQETTKELVKGGLLPPDEEDANLEEMESVGITFAKRITKSLLTTNVVLAFSDSDVTLLRIKKPILYGLLTERHNRAVIARTRIKWHYYPSIHVGDAAVAKDVEGADATETKVIEVLVEAKAKPKETELAEEKASSKDEEGKKDKKNANEVAGAKDGESANDTENAKDEDGPKDSAVAKDGEQNGKKLDAAQAQAMRDAKGQAGESRVSHELRVLLPNGLDFSKIENNIHLVADRGAAGELQDFKATGPVYVGNCETKRMVPGRKEMVVYRDTPLLQRKIMKKVWSKAKRILQKHAEDEVEAEYWRPDEASDDGGEECATPPSDRDTESESSEDEVEE
jgi:hypothetical protein